MLSDLRFALRTFRRSPTFTATAIVSLAIGIGATTAIFSVVNALLLRPLPYANADRLTILWNRSPGLGIAEDWFSTAQYFDIRNGHRGIEQVAIAIGGNDNLTGDGEPERVGTIRTSSNLLHMLGARPALGRLFTPEEDHGAPAAAILGYGTWMRRFGGDAGMVGRSIALNGQAFEVVGVLPRSFTLPREVMPTLYGAEDAEIVLPLPLPPEAALVRKGEDYNLLAKLKPGVGVQQAQAEMDGITARLRREHPEIYPPNGGLTFSVVPLQEQVVGDVRRSLMVLMAAVGHVLLIACANVANLLMSRAVARQKEIAVRAAIGAGLARLVRQLLTESALLGLSGGLVGSAVAVIAVRALYTLGTRSVPRLQEIAVDGLALAFTFAVSIACGLLFGLAPALRLNRVDLVTQLKDATRGSSGGALWGRGHHFRRLLVVGELAVSVMLLIGAGLLVRSFARVQDVAPGFDPSNVLTAEVAMTGARYTNPEVVLESYRQILDRARSVPGVKAVGAVSALPLSQMFAWGPLVLEGRTPAPGEKFVNADQRTVAGDYFAAMQIPLLRGRLFTLQDTREAPRVAIVDDHMASLLWPNVNPIGKRLRTGGMDASPDAPWITVVGVVGRVKQYTLDGDSRIAMHLPHTQYPRRAMNVVVKSDRDPTVLTSGLRAAIRATDPDLPLYGVETMTQRVDDSLARRRFSTLLLTMFAGLALVLATVGIYGVMAYLVSQGTRELGIRMALGAPPAAVKRRILRSGLAITAPGLALGVAGALALTRFMDSLLYEVAPTDPLTFGAIPLLLGAAALGASYLPARRAARIDPIIRRRTA